MGGVGLRVLLVGKLAPDLGTISHLDGAPMADVRQVDAVCTAVAECAGDSEAVLVACQTQDLAEVRRVLTMVSVGVPHVRTVLEPLPGPPLAVAVGSALVGGSKAEVEQQLAVFDALRASLWSAVWLPKAGKLVEPAPSLVQHARSWLPGAGFLAVYDRRPHVHTAARPPLAGVANAPDEAVMVFAESGVPSWVARGLISATQPISTMELRSWRNPVDSFGVSTAGEYVLVPGELADIGRLRIPPAAQCPGCGWPHPRRLCPFCGMRADDRFHANEVGGVRR